MDFSGMSSTEIICTFLILGVSVGFAVHWASVAGTAARWALNGAS